MKLATWNVNGIRARQAQLQDFIEREQPDILCLQEIKAAPDQLPVWLSEIEGYWCYWHGGKGYSGVALHVRKAAHPERPAFHHPEFDFEHRIVTVRLPQATIASIYVPNGGKDFPAKMRFLNALDTLAAEFQAAGSALVLCGDLNVARAEMDVHWGPVLERPPFVGENAQTGINPADRFAGRASGYPIAAFNCLLVNPGPGNVERAPLAGATVLGGRIVGMDTANPKRLTGGLQDQFIPHGSLARKCRPRRDNTGANDMKAAVHGETEYADRRRLAPRVTRLHDMFLEGCDAAAGRSRNRKHRRSG